MTVEQSRAILSQVEAAWSNAEGAFLPLLQKNGPVSSSKLEQVWTKLRRYGGTTVIQIGDDVLTGIIRYTLGAARANLVMAKEILTGPNPERYLGTVASLIDTAKLTIRKIETLANGVRTVQEWTGSNPTRSASSLVRLNGLGFAPPMWVALAVLAAGVVVFVVGVAVLVDAMQRAQNAEIALRAAREVCDRAEAAGDPCTPAEFQRIYEQAARAQNEISPPLLQPRRGNSPTDSLSDLLFWGGLLVVGAGVGYAVWTTLPAAQAVRHRYSQPSF